jgi:hypothetical protein
VKFGVTPGVLPLRMRPHGSLRHAQGRLELALDTAAGGFPLVAHAVVARRSAMVAIAMGVVATINSILPSMLQ